MTSHTHRLLGVAGLAAGAGMPPRGRVLLEPAAPSAAPPVRPDSPEVAHRQTEALLKAMEEGKDPAAVRRMLGEELLATRAAINDLKAAKDKGDAEIARLRELAEQNLELTRRVTEATMAAVEERREVRGGMTLRNFASEREGMEAACQWIAATDIGRKMLAGNAPDHLSRTAERVRQITEETTKRALSGVGGSGGAYVVNPLATALTGTVPKYTGIFDAFQEMPVSGNTWQLRFRGSRCQIYYVAPSVQITQSDPGNPATTTAAVQSVKGLTIVSTELLQDVNTLPSLMDIILEDHADAHAWARERNALVGTAGAQDPALAAGQNYPFTGAFNTAGFAAIPMISGRTHSSIQFDDVLNAQVSLDERFVPNASMVMHRSVLYTFRGKKDANGNYLWVPGDPLGTTGVLMGMPYRTMRSAPSTADAVQAARATLLVGDLKRALYLGTSREVSFDESTEFRFDTGEVALRSITRWSQQVAETAAAVRVVTNP